MVVLTLHKQGRKSFRPFSFPAQSTAPLGGNPFPIRHYLPRTLSIAEVVPASPA